MRKRVLVVGCGYVGSLLSNELVRLGHQVFGLRRTAAPDRAACGTGVTPLQADITRPETLASLPRDFDWVVNCAATGGGTVEEYRQLYVNGNAHLIEWLRAAPPARFVYTSSTSVYGQDDGSLVTEADPVAPAAETAQVLVETEKRLFAAREKFDFPAVVLRLAGIYGPGRGYWLKQFLRGEARLDGDGARFLNLIHLQDVVGAIIAALPDAPAGSVYNVVDDEPVSQRELFAWLAAKLHQPLPPAAAADAAGPRKRGATNKRVSNLRLKAQLGFQCQYPTFRQGFTEELLRLQQSGEWPQALPMV